MCSPSSSGTSDSLSVDVGLRTRTRSGGDENQPRNQANLPVLAKREFPRNSSELPPNKKYDHAYDSYGCHKRRGIKPTPKAVPMVKMVPQGNIPEPGTYKTRNVYAYGFRRKNLNQISDRFRRACSDNKHLQSDSAPASRRSAHPSTVRQVKSDRPKANKPKVETIPSLVTTTSSLGSLFSDHIPVPAPRFKRYEPRQQSPRFGGPSAPPIRQASRSSLEGTVSTPKVGGPERLTLSDLKETSPNTFDVLAESVRLLNEWMQDTRASEIEL